MVAFLFTGFLVLENEKFSSQKVADCSDRRKPDVGDMGIERQGADDKIERPERWKEADGGCEVKEAELGSALMAATFENEFDV